MNGARRRSSRQRGGVMVQALIVLAGLVALMASLAANQRVRADETQNRLRQRRAEIAARSALAAALGALATANTNRVSKQDDWALLGQEGDLAYDLGSASYRIQILDAGALINLNTATEAQLEKLAVTPEQISALLDWRESGLAPRADGAKDEYYNALSQPYNARLGAFATVSELLLVKGWTARTLYEAPEETTAVTAPTDDNGQILPPAALLTTVGGAPNTRADGTPRVNLNVANVNPAALAQFGIPPQLAPQIAAQAPFSSYAQLLLLPGVSADTAQQLLDGATFAPGQRLEGKINVNTASEAALLTLPNMTPDVASAIVARQTDGFASLGDLATVPGLSGGLLAQLADSFALGSDTWVVRARGESGGVGVALQAVVGLRSGALRLLSVERFPDPGIPAWWGWSAEPLSTTTPGGSL